MPDKSEYLETLEGQEIISIDFEGCVGVKDGQIIRYGEIIDPDPSLETLEALFNELFVQEFGTTDIADLI